MKEIEIGEYIREIFLRHFLLIEEQNFSLIREFYLLGTTFFQESSTSDEAVIIV